MHAGHTIAADGLRVIICVAFDHRAAPHEIAACKASVVNCPSVLNCFELSGSFDLMFEAVIPDMAAYSAQLSLCAGAVAKFASRYEANFVCKRFVRADAAERAIWVPSEDGLMRLDCSIIDKVSAQGDYVLVHSSGRSWMVHTTMQEMEEKLGREDFLRVHRSTIVRHGFVERLCHKGRTWTARLNDGSVERISNSHVADVLAKLRAGSSVAQRTSSKPVRHAEVPAELRRMVRVRAA